MATTHIAFNLDVHGDLLSRKAGQASTAAAISTSAGNQATAQETPIALEDGGISRMLNLPTPEGLDEATYTKLQEAINRLAQLAIEDSSLIEQFERSCALWERLAAASSTRVFHYETLLLSISSLAQHNS